METQDGTPPKVAAYTCYLLSFMLIGVWLKTARMSSSLQSNSSIAVVYATSTAFASTSREPIPLAKTVHFSFQCIFMVFGALERNGQTKTCKVITLRRSA